MEDSSIVVSLTSARRARRDISNGSENVRQYTHMHISSSGEHVLPQAVGKLIVTAMMYH